MGNQDLMQEGERLHNQFLEDCQRASATEKKAAQDAVGQHLMEYGCSYAEMLHQVLEARQDTQPVTFIE